jgi:hypothetical protein
MLITIARSNIEETLHLHNAIYKCLSVTVGYAMRLKEGRDQNAVTINVKISVDGSTRFGSIDADHSPAGKKAIKQDVAIALTSPRKNRLTHRVPD